ncbi:four helix bundle protein [Terrimonas sp.]|uniref:four helix bundle protein n=1 Tax=Terrimonas sp. TaxID=1914338 RepID=UPI000D514883|nr:four helix bundle protein [Terrimonas sp.]PVD52097.1 four helix bundle protein [Terrimonas sp.]
MFLTLNHQKMEVYALSHALIKECYKLTKALPPEEKYAMVSQVRRAVLSVHLNISEEVSRRSEAERKRYYEIARGSIVEIDAASDLDYLKNIDVTILGKTIIATFKLLTGVIGKQKG